MPMWYGFHIHGFQNSDKKILFIKFQLIYNFLENIITSECNVDKCMDTPHDFLLETEVKMSFEKISTDT
jgi:hypothetical protein